MKPHSVVRFGQLAAVLTLALLVVAAVSITARELPAVESPKPPADAARAERLKERERLGSEAIRLGKEGKLAEAIAAGEQALALERMLQGERTTGVAAILEWLAEAEQQREAFAQAEKRYRESLDIRTALLGADHWQVIDMRLDLDELRIWASSGAADRQRLAEADRQIDDVKQLMEKGKYREALPIAQQALATRTAILGQNRRSVAGAATWAGYLANHAGDYATAEPLYKLALEIRRKILSPRHPTYALSLTNLASVYESMNDHARAEPLYQQALAIDKQTLGENHPSYATSLNNLALHYAHKHDYARAEALNLEALEIRRKTLGESHPAFAASLNNLAALYDDQERYEKAEPLYRQALEIRRKALGERHPLYAESLNNLAVLYFQKGDYARARSLCEQAKLLSKEILGDSHPRYAAVCHSLGLLELAEGHPSEAERELRSAVENVRRSLDLMAVVQTEHLQLGMLQQLRIHLDAYISAALAANTDTATLYAEVAAWKGSVSAQQQLLRARQRAQAQDPNSESRRLFDQLEESTRRLASTARATPAPDEQEMYRQSMAKLTDQIESIKQQLSIRDVEFHRLWAERKVSPVALGGLLPPDAALVDLLLYSGYAPPTSKGIKAKADRRLVAFVLRAGKQVACVALGDGLIIADLVDRWRAGYGKSTAGEATSPGEELRRRIWEPLDAALGDAKIVLVSPDGATARIPWGALPGSKPDTYLLEERALAVVPVPQLLSETLAPHQAPSASLLLLGDVDFAAAAGQTQLAALRRSAPRGASTRDGLGYALLPGTRMEIAAIRDSFEERFGSERLKTIRKEAATEAAVRDQAPRYAFLHFATHGFFAPHQFRSALANGVDASQADASHDSTNFDPSLLSGLVLAGANRPIEADRDDGILTAFEVSELDLHGVELATLSACDTGLGQFAGGEGMLGIQRAFQVAGARSVVSSLWKVNDDATRSLMVDFYDNLWSKKLSKIEALRQAQLSLLHGGIKRGLTLDDDQPAAKHRLPPYYWAAFVLAGDWR